MVALKYKVANIDKFFCGAVLISRTKILTAAHCIHPKEKDEKNIRDISLYLGAYDLDDRYEKGVYIVAPSEIFIHPDWNPYSKKFDGDIAVILIEDEAPFSKVIKPVCMPQPDLKANEGFLTGWGKSESLSKPYENIPKQLKIPIVTNENCFLENSELVGLASSRTICAGTRNNSGPCYGDSGGGLFVKSGNVFFLQGIVSASLVVDDDKCDVSSFALFTNVPKFLDWIENPISKIDATKLSQTPSVVGSCGIMSSKTGLIQNGKNATAEQWPWIVILFNKFYHQPTIDGETYIDFEVGSLISERHIIGDGLYFSEPVGDKRVAQDPNNIKSYFGVTNLDDYAHSYSLVLDGAEKIFIHPNLGSNLSLKYANFAIIKLKTLVVFSKYISPVCLSSFTGDPFTFTGRFAYAVGMGYSESGKTKDRRYSPMRIRTKEVCDVEYKFNLGTAKNRSFYFCAGGDGKSSACWSDHPLYLKQDDKWFLFGFFQIAYNQDKGCLSSQPVLYEMAGLYFDWIQNTLMF